MPEQPSKGPNGNEQESLLRPGHSPLELIAELSARLSEFDLAAESGRALETITVLLDLGAAELLLWNPAAGRLSQVATAGQQSDALSVPASFAAGEGIPGRVLETKETIVVTPSERASGARQPKPDQLGQSAYACLPLLTAGRANGVLGVISRRPPGAADRWLLAVAAAQLALGSEILTARHQAVGGATAGPLESDGERHRALKELTTRLTDRVEAERRRISRELHDQAGQSLTAILIRLDLIAEQIADPKILQQIEQTEALAQQTLDELRRLARDLRPAVLDDLGLEEALRILVTSFSGGGLSITLSVDKPFPRLPGAIETALYRITQEALNNVVKHAQATVAAIRLHYEPRRVHLEIKDNGKGFDAAAGGVREGIGLVGMSERTDSLGGWLKVESRPGSGTRVKVELPL